MKSKECKTWLTLRLYTSHINTRCTVLYIAYLTFQLFAAFLEASVLRQQQCMLGLLPNPSLQGFCHAASCRVHLHSYSQQTLVGQETLAHAKGTCQAEAGMVQEHCTSITPSEWEALSWQSPEKVNLAWQILGVLSDQSLGGAGGGGVKTRCQGKQTVHAVEQGIRLWCADCMWALFKTKCREQKQKRHKD